MRGNRGARGEGRNGASAQSVRGSWFRGGEQPGWGGGAREQRGMVPVAVAGGRLKMVHAASILTAHYPGVVGVASGGAHRTDRTWAN